MEGDRVILLVLSATVLLLFFLVLLGLHNVSAAFSEWEYVLNPEGLQVYTMVAKEILWDRTMAQTSFEDAFVANMRGDSKAALRHLDIGSSVVGDCSDSLRKLLHNTTVIARQAAAIAPPPPLLPSRFNAGTLKTLAGINWLFHHFLITTRERLAFRFGVLRFGVREAVRLVLRATMHLKQGMGEGQRWRRVDEVRGDLGTLTDESLVTLRLVLASLAAVRRAEPVSARKTA